MHYDQWSTSVFEALSEWLVERAAERIVIEPGLLRLTITRAEDVSVDPILITIDDDLQIEFGYAVVELRYLSDTRERSPQEAAAEARSLVERWIAGTMKTCIYLGREGIWLGTALIEGDCEAAELEDGAWRVGAEIEFAEVRALRRQDWRRFRNKGGAFEEMHEPCDALMPALGALQPGQHRIGMVG